MATIILYSTLIGQEWRHTQALKQFGIQNSKQFQEVTKIQDALDRTSDLIGQLLIVLNYDWSIIVWERIKKDRVGSAFRADQEEEYEDNAGNVFNRKTFEDLRRQGLL